MIESILMTVTKEVAVELIDNFFTSDICPDYLKVEPELPTYQVEAAAHSACHFFSLPDIPLVEGDSIGVYTLNPEYVEDDVFQYSIPQFKEMGLLSFEDQTKVWTHECGHRILQKIFGNSWANELGSDFFVGVREEMLGIGSSYFEEMLGRTEASASHPGGALRLSAIKFGREVVAEMKSSGITPTVEDCIERFKQSPFASLRYEDSAYSPSFSGFIDDRAHYEKEARRCEENAAYYEKEYRYALERGDHSLANDKLDKMRSYQREAAEHVKSMSQCTK